jgi:hypothetical protein
VIPRPCFAYIYTPYHDCCSINASQYSYVFWGASSYWPNLLRSPVWLFAG